METMGLKYCTGDWIAIEPYTDGPGGSIREILPRTTELKRHAAGEVTASQTIAVNIDTVFIIAGLDGNFNPARIERMAVLAWDSGAAPVVILNKADLVDDPKSYIGKVEETCPGVPVFSLSAAKGTGTDILRDKLGTGKTGVFIGSSGVGKSTLLNTLAGGVLRKTREVRESDGKGKHTTSLKELFLVPGVGCIIDSPGIREVGLWTGEDGINTAFADVISEIETLAADCKFSDCSHQGEPGCAVTAALENGELSPDRYRQYEKLKRETEYNASRENELIRQEREKKWKKIAKMAREIKKGR
jgi:ribosome biogenesis GTPase